ncbi:MAG: GEVED domain-containing protein [Bacteroidia bacterium]
MQKRFTCLILAIVLSYASSYAQYCLPTYSFQCTSSDYIDNVIFGSINNLGTGCTSPSANNYTDYSATLSTIVNPGQSYPITVQAGPTFGQGFGVWIDFNQDLDFADPGEFVFNAPSSTAAQSGTITIPALAFPGPTRMRVLCRYASPVAAGDYCGAFNFGETEDYTVIVANPSPDDLGVSAITGLSSGCGLGTNMPVTVTVQNYGTNTQSNPQVFYSVSYNGGAFSTPVAGLLNSTIITSGSNAIYTFGPGVDLSAAGTYVIKSWTALPNDGFTLNDTFDITVTSIPTISTYPYIQTFDNGAQGWASGGISSTWALGTPNKPTISGAYSGSNCWVTSLAGNYSPTENSFIMGPCFDLSSLILPVVEMAIWWECESNWDGARVQSSIDGGTTWQTVGFVGGGQNWYNNSTVNMLNNFYGPGGGWSGWFGAGSNGWLIAKADLAGLGGQPDVMLRVVFRADGGVADGVAIDNFKVYDKPPIDMGVSAISMATGCGYSGGLTPIPVTIENYGTDPQIDPEVYYMVSYNGGPFSAPTIAYTTGAWNPGTTAPYTFIPGFDFSLPGDYTIVSWTEFPGDPDPTNDSTSITFTSIPEVSTFPYVENFNSNGGWVAGGTNSTWAWGDPSNKPIINTAYNGANCWVTNLTANYSSGDVSWLRGPCFDLTSLVAPVVEFAIWWDTESNYDGCRLQSSIDGGTTWQTVGAMGSGQNWYNNTNFSVLNNNYGFGPGWGGYNGNQSGGWLVAKNDLTGLGGQPSVLLRFVFAADVVVSAGIGIDGFKVYEKPDHDMAVTGYLQPASGGCGNTNTTVQVVVKNQGLQPQSNFPVSVFIPEIPTTLTATYTGTLGTNAIGNITIGSFNTTMGGTYTLVSYTNLSNDQLRANDTMVKAVQYAALATAPSGIDGLTCSIPASVQLVATGVDDTYYWYDAPVGGNLVGTGDTIMSPSIGATTTYYVEARNRVGYKVGPPTNASVGAGFFTTTQYNLNFEVFEEVFIDSMLVYYNGTGNIVINIVDVGVNQSTATAVASVVGSGSKRVYVGAHLYPGTYYVTNAGSSVSCYVNYTGAVYPYISTDPNGGVHIIGSSGGVNYYNGFYDWDISLYGCPSTRVPVNAVVSVLPSVNLGNDAIVCSGFVLDGTTGTGNSYSWNTGPTTPSIFIPTTGTYMLDVTNPDGCVASDTIIITVLPSPSVNLGSNIQSCDQSVTLDAGTQPSGNAFQWSSNAGAAQTQTVNISNNGSYWVAVTNPQGCTDYDSISVSFVGIPINLGPDISQCTGTPVILNAGNLGGVFYSWNTGQTSPVITVASPGLYYVIATNGTCTNSDSINVAYGTPPSVNLGPDQAACGPVTLDAGNAGATFSWSTGAATQAITVTSSNNYSVIVTGANGCATTDAINIAIYQPTTGSITSTPVTGSLYNFSSTVNAAIPYTYSWSFGDPTSGNNTSSQQNPSHSFSANGTYVVTLYINNICGSTPFTTTITVTNVGVEDEMWNAAISIYPNPNTGLFAVNGTEIDAEDLSVEVYNLQGQVVASKQIGKVNGSFSQDMDLQHLAKGIYLVNIQDGARRMYRKVIIE